MRIRLGHEVERALEDHRPVVALESTIISHGLPRPRNHEVASELERLVRAHGACPATIAVLDGWACVGLDDDELKRVAGDPEVRKLGLRDLPAALATQANGATTVSATAYLAALTGLRVFATGGLGGVHRGWLSSRDESADLAVLSQKRITVVCAGVKSILDVPATLERLETLNVSLIGYRTQDFPGFYLHATGYRLDWSVEAPEQVADVMREQEQLQLNSALLVANPVDEDAQLDPDLHDRALAAALDAAERDGIRGQQLTPYLLDFMFRETGGASLEANLAAVRSNVQLGARIAAAWQRVSERA